MDIQEQTKQVVKFLLDLCKESGNVLEIKIPEKILKENGIQIQTFLQVIAPKIEKETESKFYTIPVAYSEGANHIFKLNKMGLEKYNDRLNSSSKQLNTEGKQITTIEVLKTLNNKGRVKIYINKNYSTDPLDFSRKEYWGMLAEAAEGELSNITKACLDYFNSNDNNPLYKTYGYARSRIFKINNNVITPNVHISLITKKKISQSKT